MQAALEILGCGPTHNSKSITTESHKNHLWTTALDAKYYNKGQQPLTRTEWDRILGAYGSVTDFPGCMLAPELIETYPEAKVIIVEPDITTWFKSFQNAVVVPFYSSLNPILAVLDPTLMGSVYGVFKRILVEREGPFKSATVEEFDFSARWVYKSHYETIRKVTPTERLLEFKLEDGWQPLCEFLGKEVPRQPFPRVDVGDGESGGLLNIQGRSMVNVVRNLVVAVGLPALGWWSYSQGYLRLQ